MRIKINAKDERDRPTSVTLTATIGPPQSDRDAIILTRLYRCILGLATEPDREIAMLYESAMAQARKEENATRRRK